MDENDKVNENQLTCSPLAKRLFSSPTCSSNTSSSASVKPSNRFWKIEEKNLLNFRPWW